MSSYLQIILWSFYKKASSVSLRYGAAIACRSLFQLISAGGGRWRLCVEEYGGEPTGDDAAERRFCFVRCGSRALTVINRGEFGVNYVWPRSGLRSFYLPLT